MGIGKVGMRMFAGWLAAMGLWLLCALMGPATVIAGAAQDGAAGVVGAAGAAETWIALWVRPVDRADLVALTRLGAVIETVRWETVERGEARIRIPSGNVAGLRRMGLILREAPPEGRREGFPEGRVPRMGEAGYPDIAGLASDLMALARDYPDICRVESIGASVRGRDIWAVRISDRVDVREDEPEVLMVGGIHGDEPISMMLCLSLIHLLVESYDADPAIAARVNAMEIWVMPLVNPDGYAAGDRFNAQGIDLNRSFPDRLYDPVDTPEGRPAETAAIMNWVAEHSPTLSAGFHGGELVVNYPYDADPDPYAGYAAAPDDALFREQSLAYARENPDIFGSPWFSDGIVNGAQWYHIRGGMQDWLYVWRGCNQVTVEVSLDKWPPAAELPGYWEANRNAMLAYMDWALRGARGVVIDGDTGAPVAARARAAGIDHVVYADPDAGDYHRMLLPGVYDLVFSADGYATRIIRDVRVGEGAATERNVRLYRGTAGDLDGNGTVDLADAVLALRAAAGIGSEGVRPGGDVDGDGRIGVPEAIFIMGRAAAAAAARR